MSSRIKKSIIILVLFVTLGVSCRSSQESEEPTPTVQSTATQLSIMPPTATVQETVPALPTSTIALTKHPATPSVTPDPPPLVTETRTADGADLTPTADTDEDDAHLLYDDWAQYPEWAADGQSVFFSAHDGTLKAIDIDTHQIVPIPESVLAYRPALSETIKLLPEQVFVWQVARSPSRLFAITAIPIPSTGPVEEYCDGEACAPLPANEVWLLDLTTQSVEQFVIQDQIVTKMMGFQWSHDESKVLIGTSPWFSGSGTGSVWIADLASQTVFPVMPRDPRIQDVSISPDGSLLLLHIEEESTEGSKPECVSHLFELHETNLIPLPGLPCRSHLWLWDNETVIFHEKQGTRHVFWAYEVYSGDIREIAHSTRLPGEYFQIALAPDGQTLAITPIVTLSDNGQGLWLVTLHIENDS